jgi:prophage regulatory protein
MKIIDNQGAPMQTNSILRLPAVKGRVGLSRSSIYARMAEGAFPKPVRLGPRAVGWVESEISAWIARQIAQSREPAP